MNVHAHPDDESSKGAASTARYVSEGVDVHVVTCTGGERGSILNPNMDRPDVLANIAEIRRQEMERAREILGVTQDWLGFVDSGYPEGDPPPPLPDGCFAALDLQTATAPLVRLMRSFRPHVVTTYDENGGYPHPDHVMCHRVSMAAYEAAGDPDRYPEAGAPWVPQKLYYHHSFHRERTQALNDEMLRRGMESPYAERLAEWEPDPAHDARITTRVPCAEFFARARPGVAGARHAGRPRGGVVRLPGGGAPGRLADRGLRAGAQPRADLDTRGRPVRGPARLRPPDTAPGDCVKAETRRPNGTRQGGHWTQREEYLTMSRTSNRTPVGAPVCSASRSRRSRSQPRRCCRRYPRPGPALPRGDGLRALVDQTLSAPIGRDVGNPGVRVPTDYRRIQTGLDNPRQIALTRAGGTGRGRGRARLVPRGELPGPDVRRATAASSLSSTTATSA